MGKHRSEAVGGRRLIRGLEAQVSEAAGRVEVCVRRGVPYKTYVCRMIAIND